jgi:hypothetical protein
VTVVAGQDLAPGPSPAATAADRPPGERRARRIVLAAAAVGVVVLAALVGALAVPPTTQGDLEPTSAAPVGSRAVAEILRRQGVALTTVTLSTDAAQTAGPTSTLLVVHPELVGPDQLDRLAGTRARLVLVEPDLPTLVALAPFAQVAGVEDVLAAEPACDQPAARAAGSALAGGSVYQLTAGPDAVGAVLCYPVAGGGSRGSLVVGRASGREVVVLGQSDILRNAELGSPNGNAALALWLLGEQPSLVWYLPDPAELSRAGQAPTISDLLPPWVGWVGAQLVVAVLLALAWRSRRLGRLVTEPLPVVVRAAETQEGRARLYRRAGAYGRASATLRTAALRRVAQRLDVPVDAPPGVVVELAAAATGLSHPFVHAAFLGPAPTDDRGLVRLADDLAAVEAALAATSAGHTVR